jgi:hypothetical protein
MSIVKYIESEDIVLDGVSRDWYRIESDDYPEYNNLYAITSENELIDSDGYPVNLTDFRGMVLSSLIYEKLAKRL